MATPPTPPTPSWRPSSYDPACEAALNHQIQLELYVIYVYESMASYFENQICRRYLSQCVLGQVAVLKEHVKELIWLQNQRSGYTRQYESVPNWPEFNYWDSSLKALDHALDLAVHVNQNLRSLQQLAVEKEDAHLLGFLGNSPLQAQVKSIEEVRGHVSTYPTYPRNPEESLGEHLMDKLSLDDKKN